MRILNFGSLNLDYVYRVHAFVRPGETAASLGREVVCGGKGLNQSVALRQSGASVWHAGCVGAEDGQPLLDLLSARGVDTGLVRKVDVPSGHTVIQVNDEGENCILLFGGANQAVGCEQIAQTLAHFGKGDLLVMQNEISGMPELMRAAKERGMALALNPSPVAGAESALPIGLADWLFVNEEEAAALAGGGTRDVEIRISARYPAARIVITYGARGAAAVGGGRERAWQEARRVKPVDTTGAGDTFLGFFLGRMSQGRPETECLRYAAQASALCVQRKGAAPSIPALAEVERALGAEA